MTEDSLAQFAEAMLQELNDSSMMPKIDAIMDKIRAERNSSGRADDTTHLKHLVDIAAMMAVCYQRNAEMALIIKLAEIGKI